MIATGMDGWSRGNFDAGISLGHDLRQYLPLDVSAFEYPNNNLRAWCESWIGKDYAPPLGSDDWYEGGHLPGVHIWSPPPAAALVALKQLARARLKRPSQITHVVIIPRLLYQEEWRRRFEREMDFWFTLQTGSVWPHSAFKPLLVGISFPLIREFPWLVRLQREQVVSTGRTLSKMSKTCHLRVRDYLRKLWASLRPFPTL